MGPPEDVQADTLAELVKVQQELSLPVRQVRKDRLEAFGVGKPFGQGPLVHDVPRIRVEMMGII